MLMARENWTSSIGFILASAGSAIGLGNIWKFPYMAGENGGGTFVFVYLLCVFLIGLPVMCSEMFVGRFTRRNVINALGKVEQTSNSSLGRWMLCILSGAAAVLFVTIEAWLLVAVSVFGIWAFARKGFAALGWVCCALSFVILSYYAVVGGWIVEYIWRSFTASFGGIDGATTTEVAQQAGAVFGQYIKNPQRVLVGYLIFMGLTGAIILGGIQAGIERVSKILMPALFVLLLVVIVRSVTLPGAWNGVVFLLKPTAEAFTPKVIMMALGQAFFSLSLGMAITVTYGSYLNKQQSILRAAGWVGILDTLAALLAGLAIFPAVFSVGLEPSSGPGLIFGALPATFAAMPLGAVWATCFFIMLLIAAVTSSASLLECMATVLIERMRKRHQRASRRTAVTIALSTCTVLGLLSVFSTANWSVMPCLQKVVKWSLGSLTLGSWFDTVDNLASNWGLPFAALGIALLIG
ncbi:MAG: sodium-dependent transporter, partial [Kiritimatiellae bacterium]|nr:sodium-dependent transporter [Kiritimatiellia bacterium]